jgi:hypothetical protein
MNKIAMPPTSDEKSAMPHTSDAVCGKLLYIAGPAGAISEELNT